MAQLTYTIDDALIPRLQAAYGVDTNAKLKQAIAKEIKQKVVNHEVYLTSSTEQAKIEAAETARKTAVAMAESTATSEITLT